MNLLLEYICGKYKLNRDAPSPIVIPDAREGGFTTMLKDLGYLEGAEIGVERGRFSERICIDNPGVHLHCIDPWRGYKRYNEHIQQHKMDQFFAQATERLAPYNTEIVRLPSVEAAKLYDPGSLDFVYIDGDHELTHVISDIAAWEPIVRKGGIVAGHDYTPEHANHRIPLHVMQAVDGYTSAYRIAPWFLWQKDDGPSWMWMK